jgi:hypothetical protein
MVYSCITPTKLNNKGKKMIHLETQCPICGKQFVWETYCDIQRQGPQFVVPMTEHVLCPGCNHKYIQGESLPVLSIALIDREDYELIMSRYLGALPDDFRLTTRYAIGNGNEFALCFMRQTFCLLFMGHDGGMLDMERVSGAFTEEGAQEKARTIALIIGATKIEE